MSVSQPRQAQRMHAAEGSSPIVDCDVHPNADGNLLPYLPERWRQHLSRVGVRGNSHGVRSPHRPMASRLDAAPPGGGSPGSDPEFAREHYLDEYGISAAVLNPLEAMGGANGPVALDVALCQ